ncbi:hypothetical protein PUN28_001392 [Cardiocondyla obscurior]|uniref:tRNA-uridine aminocarboxypropyltransferase 1 n=1 Tax=Cardiocondyla obscurior TaxID=286306 RepID=A0AAW2H588_9HYME
MANCAVESSTDRLSEVEDKQMIIDRNPFARLRIKDTRALSLIQKRGKCDFCHKSRKFFCYTCYHPVVTCLHFPRVKLPIKIDIIKHPREIDGKSTAAHAAVLAPMDVKIYTYPDFPEILNKEETVLVFPNKDSAKNITVEDLFKREERSCDISPEIPETIFPIKRAIFIDSTWQQTKSIYKDQRLRELRCVILRSRISQFWRHQKKSPRWYLATIEAIHQFLVELHTYALGIEEEYNNFGDLMESNTDKWFDYCVTNNEEIMQKYNGQYDNLLYFFKYMYEKIHSMYNHNRLLAYKRPVK